MSVARALVFGVNARFLLAAGAVAASVSYALLAGSSVAGLRSAEKVLQGEVFVDQGVFALPDLGQFSVGEAPNGTKTLLVHDAHPPFFATTRTPWPFRPGHAVPGPFANPGNLSALGLSLVTDPPAYVDGAGGDWVLIPPEAFDARFPALAGQATVAVGTGPSFLKAPAVDRFYSAGAEQVTDGLAFVAATSVFVAGVVAAVATRLEVQARRADYALVEALGGPRLARRLIAGRAAVTVGAGIVAGTAFAIGAFAFLNRSQTRIHLAADPIYTGATLAAVALVGTLVAAIAGARSLRGELAEKLARRGVAVTRFRGPLRFMLVTPRIAATLAVALMATVVTVSVVLGAVAAPQRLLDPGRGGEVVATAAGNPLRGSVPRFAAEHAHLFDDVGAVSPEVYVPTVVAGEPVLVRGVHFNGWVALAQPWLLEGRWPTQSGEAVIGEHAASRLDLTNGSTIRVPAAYRAAVLDVRVVGTFGVGGLEADEIIIGLDDASSLANLNPSSVHLIRIRDATNATKELLSSPGIQVMRLTMSPDPPAAGLAATVRADVINTGNGVASRTLVLRANEVEKGTQTIQLASHARGSVTFPFVVPDVPKLSIRVNPAIEADVSPAQLRVVTDGVATVEKGLRVRVFTPDGFPAKDVELRTPWETRTAALGEANLTVGAVGKFAVEARTPEAFGGREVIATREAWLTAPHLVIRKVALQAAGDVDASRGAYDGIIDVTNFGGVPFDAGLVANTTGPRLTVPTNVLPFSEATLTFHGEAPYGPVRVEVRGVVAEVVLSRTVSPADANVHTVMDVIRLKEPVGFETPESRTQRFLNDIFDAVGTAVSLIVLATVLHGAVVVWAAVQRETAERAVILRTLRSLGATDGQIQVRAAREALVAALPGVAGGLLLTPAVFAVAGLFDLPHAFGHRIRPELDVEVLLRVSAMLVLAAVLSALMAVRDRPHGAAARRPRPLSELAR